MIELRPFCKRRWEMWHRKKISAYLIAHSSSTAREWHVNFRCPGIGTTIEIPSWNLTGS